jgi:hypothetical protein
VSDEIRAEGRAFAKFLESLPEEERVRGNEIERLQVAREHRQFREAFRLGNCDLCHRSLAAFDRGLPCPHWLLNPPGFKKDALTELASRYGFFQIQSYLRWVANEEDFARNINNLPEESTGTKMFELTIRYKNLEWSFSCAESDYLGHEASTYASHPHYHLQMRVDGRSFINYGDYHLPLSKMDIINIEAMQAFPLYKQGFSHGEGMHDVLTNISPDFIVKKTTSEGNYEDAPFRIQTLLVADEGTTINGDDLNAIIQEARSRKVTIASLMHKIPNASARVVVSPGPGVVEQAPRSRGRRGAKPRS